MTSPVAASKWLRKRAFERWQTSDADGLVGSPRRNIACLPLRASQFPSLEAPRESLIRNCSRSARTATPRIVLLRSLFAQFVLHHLAGRVPRQFVDEPELARAL